MKSIWARTILVCVGLASLPSCTAKYQQMLREREARIQELYTQVAELSASNQDLESRYQGARDRAKTLEASLARRSQSGESGLDSLKKALGPNVDVRVKDNRLSLGINNKVTFNPGSAALKGSAGEVLKKVAGVLERDFPGRRILVEGHTDSDPIKRTKDKFRSNRHLSLERADAVASYLVKNCGIDESSVVVAGYGPHEPLVQAGGDQAKAANRRVEIVVGAAR